MLNLSIDKLLVGSNPHNKYQSQEERKKESSLKVFEGECFSLLKVLRKVLTAVESLKKIRHAKKVNTKRKWRSDGRV